MQRTEDEPELASLTNILEQLTMQSSIPTAFGKVPTLLIPIAAVGCGKTTLGKLMSQAFHFGHVQNDDLNGKNKRTIFVERCLNAIALHTNVVYADKNNHKREHRTDLIKGFRQSYPQGQIVVMEWDIQQYAVPDIVAFLESRIRQRYFLSLKYHH